MLLQKRKKLLIAAAAGRKEAQYFSMNLSSVY